MRSVAASSGCEHIHQWSAAALTLEATGLVCGEVAVIGDVGRAVGINGSQEWALNLSNTSYTW